MRNSHLQKKNDGRPHTLFIVIAIGFVGPLALPLLWLRPHSSLAWKIGLSLATLILTWVLFQSTMESLKVIQEYYDLLNGL